jgi:hypothetical protein
VHLSACEGAITKRLQKRVIYLEIKTRASEHRSGFSDRAVLDPPLLHRHYCLLLICGSPFHWVWGVNLNLRDKGYPLAILYRSLVGCGIAVALQPIAPLPSRHLALATPNPRSCLRHIDHQANTCRCVSWHPKCPFSRPSSCRQILPFQSPSTFGPL